MPSIYKTANLLLNKWQGSDKPKKDDFNADNEKLDAAYASMQSSVNGISQSLSSHSSNAQTHITSIERTGWNAKDKSTVGTYQGDGAGTRKITLGFQARIGLLFAAGKLIQAVDVEAANTNTYAGFFGAQGCTEGISADSTGFTVMNHNVARPNGLTWRFNEAGVTYVYMAWQ